MPYISHQKQLIRSRVFQHPRLFSLIAVVAVWWVVCATPELRAQTFDATHLDEPTELNAVWLVRAGDDPAFAQPGLDDSKWMPVDPKRSLHEYFRERPEVLWYRLHVKTDPRRKGLAIEEHNLASAFEVFVDGRRIFKSGRVAPFVAYTQDATLLAPIPDSAESFVIALRVHNSETDWSSANPGLFPENLILGREKAVYNSIWMGRIGSLAMSWLVTLLSISVALVAIALYAAQQRQKEYLWIFLAGLATVMSQLWGSLELACNVPYFWKDLVTATAWLSSVFLVLLYFAFLRLRMSRWLKIYLAISLTAGALGRILFSQGRIPEWLFVFSYIPYDLVVYGIILILLIVHLRRGNKEAGVLLVPAILNSVTLYGFLAYYPLVRIPSLRNTLPLIYSRIVSYTFGPFGFSLHQVPNALFWISLAVILVWRSNRVSQEQTRLEGEMEAARQVQQVILPDATEAIPGFRVNSVYKPAQQVGGDFFQVLPAGEGGLLLVFGDVAGKGLPAAMLVAVLVGAVCTVARFTHDPAEILAELNTRLLGRTSGGFCTCLAAFIDANGGMKLANAGQLPPYLDGDELQTPGALPLGIAPLQTYEISEFPIAPGSRIVFYSDGVIEAQDQAGDLLGFERSRNLSALPAEEIAKAAADFGQNDDITVVIIEREAVLVQVA